MNSFPVSFAGNPWTFGGALFSLTVVSALSLATMGQIWAEIRHHGPQWNSPAGISRLVMFSLMMSFFMRSAPDVVFLWWWGGTSAATIATVLVVKRNFDALSIIPFLAALILLTRGRPAIIYQLIRQPVPVDLWPTWPMVRKNVGIIVLALVIAVGVTLAR